MSLEGLGPGSTSIRGSYTQYPLMAYKIREAGRRLEAASWRCCESGDQLLWGAIPVPLPESLSPRKPNGKPSGGRAAIFLSPRNRQEPIVHKRHESVTSDADVV